MHAPKKILVTGASGFVGRYLRVALTTAGYELRLGTRDPEGMARRDPGHDWVHFDTSDVASMESALDGCYATYFLVHEVGRGRHYAAAEERAAHGFAAACSRAKVQRIIYLGGVAPEEARSRHLRSRARTGEILSSADGVCIELRAAMVIGEGSASWKMVTDLARRLPAMLLPRWLGNHSWPIGIDDVVFSLLAALQLPTQTSRVFDIPGSQRVSHRDMLLTVAEATGHHPVMMGVPVLSPRLSSYWIGLVTSVEFGLARELVEGLVTDLDPTEENFWDGQERGPLPLGETIELALRDNASMVVPSPASRTRLQAIGRARQPRVPP